jgi:hypothetical protein
VNEADLAGLVFREKSLYVGYARISLADLVNWKEFTM